MSAKNEAALVGPDNPQEDVKKKPVGKSGTNDPKKSKLKMMAATVGPDNPQEDLTA